MTKYALILAGLGALWTGAAAAEDFTFTIPVAVSHLPPEITSMLVSCSVSADEAHGRRMIGSGSVSTPITGGGYSGDVVVAFNATLPEERSLAETYICVITSFTAPTTGVSARVYYPGDATTRPERFFPLAPGASFVTRAAGSVR